MRDFSVFLLYLFNYAMYFPPEKYFPSLEYSKSMQYCKNAAIVLKSSFSVIEFHIIVGLIKDSQKYIRQRSF